MPSDIVLRSVLHGRRDIIWTAAFLWVQPKAPGEKGGVPAFESCVETIGTAFAKFVSN